MPLKIEPEFKQALINLPEKEKDKYFLRLLKKDDILFHRLHFELIDSKNQTDLRNELEEKIKASIQGLHTSSLNYVRHTLRYLSGDITYHVKITGDKFGEPYLNTIMILEVLKKFNPQIYSQNKPTIKLLKYIVGRVFKILTQVKKMHPDDQFEFQELFNELSRLLTKNELISHYCLDCMFDFNWLINNDFPDKIFENQKLARAAGMI